MPRSPVIPQGKYSTRPVHRPGGHDVLIPFTSSPGQCWAATATARTAALLPIGKTAYLLPGKSAKDRYGRRLYYVWSAKGVHVNRNLIRFGYGRAALFKPNDKYLKLFRSERSKAQAEKLRIWSGKCDKPGGTPTPAPTKPSVDDPRFRTCGEANAKGYGPYVRGKDPEYAWHQDRDGDGVVCER
ncbi:thermonuclease family protein [Nonomuraea purpurea]|uniref:Thermonuclease family protein n=1 Tax=Nonomuraea purpurea TaxID=1849276 RepID=A0ABV8G0H1_9ACTN